MKEKEKGKIQSVTIENFTCFENVHLDFSTGINLFIGENGTGKTHVLKILYNLFMHNPIAEAIMKMPDEKINKKADWYGIIDNFFQNFGHNVNLAKKGKSFYKITSVFDSQKAISLKSTKKTDSRYTNEYGGSDNLHFPLDLKPLYIPSNEILSIYKGFIDIYLKKELGYDKIYFDLAVALSGNKLKGDYLLKAEKLISEIKTELDIDIEDRDGKFSIIFNKENLEIDASLAAEGIKKLAQIMRLVLNGNISKDTILFIDEPEVNLNPKYIRLFANFLMALSKAGVQIFVATHDYLLAHYLSTKADYREVTDAPPMKFFAFYKENNASQVESGESLAEIQNNTLLDEYAALYDMEGQLFSDTLKK